MQCSIWAVLDYDVILEKCGFWPKKMIMVRYKAQEYVQKDR
jgi:hypothetical protein